MDLIFLQLCLYNKSWNDFVTEIPQTLRWTEVARRKDPCTGGFTLAHNRASRFTLITLSLAATLLLYQNCGEYDFSDLQPRVRGLSLKDVELQTKKDHPVPFATTFDDGTVAGEISFSKDPGNREIKTNSGTFTITDPVKFTGIYTPNSKFVGLDEATVFATDVYGAAVPATIRVSVGNILNLMQPALAVRGFACNNCHAQVQSNMLSDYGLGDPFYFTKERTFYRDWVAPSNPTQQLGLINLNGNKFYVPKADIRAEGLDAFKAELPNRGWDSVKSLLDFVRKLYEPPQAYNNKPEQFVELENLKIRLPTEQRIREVFGNPTVSSVYVPDTQDSVPLKGLKSLGTNVFQVEQLECDGDLFLDGTVIFSNAHVKSINGCRIYTTGSVFIEGPLISEPVGNTTLHNTQILSAISIWKGHGMVFDAQGQFCETTGAFPPTKSWFLRSGSTGCLEGGGNSSVKCDSLGVRLYHFYHYKAYASNIARDDQSLANLTRQKIWNSVPDDGVIASERAKLEAALNRPLRDASCEAPVGRNVTYERLLLAAPYVSSRYYGDFIGAIVAESALMSLGNFKFQFDPVFRSVSTFSLLADDELIQATLPK